MDLETLDFLRDASRIARDAYFKFRDDPFYPCPNLLCENHFLVEPDSTFLTDGPREICLAGLELERNIAARIAEQAVIMYIHQNKETL